MKAATKTPPVYGRVDLWVATLDLVPEALAALAALLSREERARAETFRSERDRDRFNSRRGWLRCLLGEYLGAEPRGLKFTRFEKGKPQLVWPGEPSLRFSSSSSNGLAVFAVTTEEEVGVDVEFLRPEYPMQSVARRYFDGVEQRAFETLEGVAQVKRFFETWTRKEAYLKGMGIGIVGLESRVIAAGSRVHYVQYSGRPQVTPDAGHWTLANFDAGVGYAAAVAVEGRQLVLPSTAQQLNLSAMLDGDPRSRTEVS